MRIVYCADVSLASVTAATIQVMHMCQAFSLRGHDVTLIAIAPGNRDADVRSCRDRLGISVPFAVVALTAPMSPRLRCISFIRVLQVLATLKPDLVYVRNVICAQLVAMAGHRLIFESHSYELAAGHLGRLCCRLLIAGRRMARFVTISRALRQAYLRAYPSLAARLVVAADAAAEPEPETSAHVAVADDGRLRVGYVGHLYPGKGMEIIAALAGRCPWAVFHVVGGPLEIAAYWRQRTEDINNIMIHGPQEHRDVGSWLAAFDVVLLPNCRVVFAANGGDIGRWTSPLKLFEYLAAGKAVVASDLPVLREVLEDGVNALLCPPDQPKAWQSALRRLSDHCDLRAGLEHRAYASWRDRYTWSHRAALVLSGLE